ncbi:AAA family ATPase [Erysipelothrix sp. Poltava]|nr:AAA family ATPase [Erysipelothrix sp. Poltava]
MMELIELEMKNFRQYLGQSKIVFAQGNLNTTVILGENGKGKTGIYRAYDVCLIWLETDSAG